MSSNNITLDQLNSAIDKIYPHARLGKSHNYFYLYSDDPKMEEIIGGLRLTRIYVADLSLMTLEEWIRAVEYLMEERGLI